MLYNIQVLKYHSKRQFGWIKYVGKHIYYVVIGSNTELYHRWNFIKYDIVTSDNDVRFKKLS